MKKMVLGRGDYLYLDIIINDQKYSGWTKCVFDEVSWEDFIRDLEEFINFNKEEAHTLTGWGGEIYFSIKFTFKDKKGHVSISGEIGYPVIADKDTNPSISHKMVYSMETDIITVENFIAYLKNIKSRGKVIFYT